MVKRTSFILATCLVASGCVESISEGSVRNNTPAGQPNVVAIAEDTGTDGGPLSRLEAGIFIDPDGCHIWMIDDGLEGYWSRRLDPRSGLPVCTQPAPPGSIVGDFSSGSPGIEDRVPRLN
jgi:hypothetical protein